MLTQREVKYTSAAPRCTCLPPRQHCAGVALGSPLPTPQHCWFGRRTSTTRLRLVVLASSSSTMLWSCTRCPPDSTAMLILRKDKYTSAAPRCTYLPPHQHCTEVALGGQQVHLGYASVYLLSSSCNFSSSPHPTTVGLILKLDFFLISLHKWDSRLGWSEKVPLPMKFCCEWLLQCSLNTRRGEIAVTAGHGDVILINYFLHRDWKFLTAGGPLDLIEI